MKVFEIDEGTTLQYSDDPDGDLIICQEYPWQLIPQEISIPRKKLLEFIGVFLSEVVKHVEREILFGSSDLDPKGILSDE